MADRSTRIRDFLLYYVDERPHDLVAFTAQTFGLSRQQAHQHVRRLVDEGLIIQTGRTRGVRYELATLAQETIPYSLKGPLEEHEVWRDKVAPALRLLKNLSRNAERICEYAFTEMLNNAIDHSAGAEVLVTYYLTAESIRIEIADDGVGIFKKIADELGLEDDRHAVLELAKGKVTTDPTRHSGEGIFFTSRAVQRFGIMSGELFFGHIRDSRDWLLEDEGVSIPGTIVDFVVDTNSEVSLTNLFDQYTSEEDDFGFTKTIVPVSLLQFGEENLVSRSQAKRLLTRFDRFREVVLDFAGVETIGQGFADEIFRVFVTSHPDVSVYPINANEDVTRMIRRALGASSDPAQLRLIDSTRK